MKSIEQDLWLSKMLGKPAYRIVGQVFKVGAADLVAAGSFFEARVDVADPEGLAHLQGLGFAVVDCNLTLERPAEGAVLNGLLDASSPKIRFATVEDERGVRELARESFEYNRFRRDPRIPNEIANKIKEEWVANFFAGVRGDWMVVAEDETGIVGFIQLMSRDSDILLIDLVAVASHRQRRGIARLMTSFALQNCMEQRVRMQVGTQLSNRSSLRLYESMGFKVSDVVYLLHLHKEAD